MQTDSKSTYTICHKMNLDEIYQSLNNGFHVKFFEPISKTKPAVMSTLCTIKDLQ